MVLVPVALSLAVHGLEQTVLDQEHTHLKLVATKYVHA